MRLYPELTEEIVKMTIKGELEWQDVAMPDDYNAKYRYRCVKGRETYELFKAEYGWRITLNHDGYNLNRWYKLDRLLIRAVRKSSERRPSFRDITVKKEIERLKGIKSCFVGE